MATDWFDVTNVPATGAALTSATIRAEFALIASGISAKLPTMTGAGSEFWRTNAGGTAVETLTASEVRTALSLVIGTNVQAWDADLDAIAALSSTGIAVRTASNTWAQRTITGTSAEITVTNGDGVSGNPTLTLPTALTFTGKTVTGGTFSGITLSGTIAGTPTFGGALLFTGGPQFQTTNQHFSFYETDAALDAKWWTFASDSGTFQLQSRTDAGAFTANLLQLTRAGLLTITTLDVGATTDTTISRSSAGIIAVEGVAVPTISSTHTLTNKTLTSPTINGAAFSGTLTGTPTTTGLWTFSRVASSDTTPGFRWIETDASAGNTSWDLIASSETLFFRAAGDGFGTATSFMTVDRTNNTCDEIDFTTTSLRHGNVEIPTISSTHTLTTKTIALGSNTVSGTIAQFNTALTDGDFVTKLDADTSTATVENTTTETTVYSFSVPANTLSTNKALRYYLIADWINNSGSSETCTLRIKFGSTTVGTFAETFTSNAVRRPCVLRGLVSANGATNAQVANSDILFGSVPATLDGTLSANNTVKNSMHTSIAEDTTSSKTFSITVEHSVADANIGFRAFAVHLELV